MKLDRSLQLQILKTLRDAYPNVINNKAINDISNDHDSLMANMIYLEEHNFIDSKKPANLNEIIIAKITATGLDFLEDDGGLSAILKTVYIKIDPEDLKQILSNKIIKSDITQDKKNTLLTQIKNLPSETLKIINQKLVNLGLDNAQDVYHLIENYLKNQF